MLRMCCSFKEQLGKYIPKAGNSHLLFGQGVRGSLHNEREQDDRVAI